MIHEISECIVKFYGAKVGYSQDEMDVCEYGMELVISDIIAIMIVAISSIFTRTILYTLILLMTFIILRHQAGGFHASTHTKCNILFFGGYILSMLLIKLTSTQVLKCLIIAMNIISFIAIIIYAPVSHPNRPVSNKKKKKFRMKSIILTSILTIVSVVLSVYEQTDRYGLCITLGIFFVGLSVMAETIKQSIKTKNIGIQ